MEDNPVETASRIILGMVGIGLGIALSAVLVTGWVTATIGPALGPGEEEAISTVTPFAVFSISLLGAPVIAGIFGLSEGSQSSTSREAALIGVACLFGTVLMVLAALSGVALADTSVPSIQDNSEDTSGDEPGDDEQTNNTNGTEQGEVPSEQDSDDGLPGPLDIIGLAGLCGAGAMVSGFITTRFAAC